MNRTQTSVAVVATGLLALPALGGGWVDFQNETVTRMPVALNNPATSTSDSQEKDYAWGDVDQDGDVDLICVRKQPFTSTGKDTNVLFMNEGIAEGHAFNGVLVDRTADYAVASDVSGDQGFLTPTNDRDVALADINGDGWLDVITATTLTDNQAKHLSHPRVYVNLGESAGVWQGFEYQDARVPQMHPTAGPRFCSVAAGDVDGDGDLDLYFGDYDSGGAQIFDYNNRLLVNDGNGFFADETSTRLGDLFNYGGTVGFASLANSAFGAASFIADMNGDGTNDVVKQTSLNAPTHVAVTYNNTANEGVFSASDYVQYDQAAPYFVTVGDLNNDGMLDMVVVDDGNDRYYLNQGNNGAGHANFSSISLGSVTAGFGGNAWIEDLNNDGFDDVIITDVDVDIGGCTRDTVIFRNLGNTPNISLQVQGQVIPANFLNGVHDMAVFDINGDGWMDIVSGRCQTTEIWMNNPPVGLAFSYPTGTPAFVEPGMTTTIQAQLTGIGDATPEAGSGQMFLSVNDGPFNEVPGTDLGGDLYEFLLPASECTDSLAYYFVGGIEGGSTNTDPPNAPVSTYMTTVADGTELRVEDTLEGDTSGWSVENDASLTSGAWEAVDPNGTLDGGSFAAPEEDATAGIGTVAFVTQNGAPGGTAGAADVDGGPTRLISPQFDLEGTDGNISYARWIYSSGGAIDSMTVDVSNDDGATWVPVPGETSSGTGGAWVSSFFRAGDYVAPTSTMRVRFSIADSPNDGITEGGVDDFRVEALVCAPGSCDITGDNVYDVSDLLALLGAWGACTDCPADLNGDNVVDVSDLLALLSAWGPC